ncbi:MAG: hypothetical protein K2N70_03520, partial [Helicobacter sp.]|nr:hypothetical protein [Helicobacter sp.]
TRFHVSLRASVTSVAINEQGIPTKQESQHGIASASPRNDTWNLVMLNEAKHGKESPTIGTKFAA